MLRSVPWIGVRDHSGKEISGLTIGSGIYAGLLVARFALSQQVPAILT